MRRGRELELVAGNRRVSLASPLENSLSLGDIGSPGALAEVLLRSQCGQLFRHRDIDQLI